MRRRLLAGAVVVAMAVSVGLAFGQAANALVVTSFSVIPTTVAPGGNFTITQNITCAGPTATIVLTDHSGNPAGQLVVNDGAGVWPGTVASSAAPGLATFTEYCNDQGSSTAQTVGTLTVTLTTETTTTTTTTTTPTTTPPTTTATTTPPPGTAPPAPAVPAQPTFTG